MGTLVLLVVIGVTPKGTRGYLFFACIDLAFVLLLAIGVGFQWHYTPKLTYQCKHDAESFADGMYGRLAAEQLKRFKPGKDSKGNPLQPPTPKGTCDDFFLMWIGGITLM